MALRGDLASVDLAQVFQMLALNKKVGLLSIHSSKLWKVLYFDQRGVTVHHNVHSVLDRVVAAFVRTGRLSPESVDEVRDHAVRMGQSLADSLLAGGYLEGDELGAQYRLELEEEIYDLFFCRDAKFEFHEKVTSLEGRDGEIDERFFFNCDSIIMEAARRIDEWAYISERIPSTAEVLVATVDDIDEGEFGSDGRAVFDLLDGRRNVARVIELTGLTNFLVCKMLSQLLDAGMIAPVAPEELIDLGNECMADGRVTDAISLFERAIEEELGLPESHDLAAKAYQEAHEYELAVYHMESEAEWRIGADDLQGAAQCLFAAKELLPTNLRARERLVELTLGPGAVKLDGFDALAEGKELVDLLTEFGDIERVRALLERLLLVEPNDPDLKKALVNVHVRAGDQKRVVQLYESIADDLVRQNKPLEAVSYLQKILLIDRSRADISERVRRLYEFDERARRRSRTLGALAVLFFVLLALGAGYWFYNERAGEEFARIDVAEMLEHNDFAGARSVYADFVLAHPLTTAVSQAESELRKIDAEIEKFEARRASERAAQKARLEKLRKEYRGDWARHREQFLDGHPEQAFASVEKVRALVEEADDAEDVAWALEQQVERVYENLKTFLDESRQLGAIYDERLAAGDWAGAREAALRLAADYEHTTDGRRAMVPVLVATRPEGAQLLHDGRPLMRKVDGEEVPVRTPGLVLCRADQPVQLQAALDGFLPRDLIVDGREQAQIDVVLQVQPVGRVDFGAPGQSGAAAGGGYLAVGLRGGQLGIADADGGNVRVHELGGLKELYGDPVVRGGRVFFVSNENTLEAVPVDPAVECRGWPVRLTSEPVAPLVAGNGRLVLVDADNVVHCWEQGTARRVWGASLGGAPAGAPTIAGRSVFVATRDGRVLGFDVATGRSLGVLRSPVDITTGVLFADGLLYFGGADEQVRAVDFEAGRVVWSRPVGRPLASDDLALGSRTVLAVASGGVVAFDRATGDQRGMLATEHTVLGLQCRGDRGFVVLRRERTRRTPASRVLFAVDADDAQVRWEYPLPDEGATRLGVDDLVVALPMASGELVLFR